MTLVDLIAAIAGTGAAGTIAGAVAGRITGRNRDRAEIARLHAERDQIAATAAVAITQAVGVLADELRTELTRMGDELARARDAAEAARLEAASLRVELAAARGEIERLRRLVATVTHPHEGNHQ